MLVSKTYKQTLRWRDVADVTMG